MSKDKSGIGRAKAKWQTRDNAAVPTTIVRRQVPGGRVPVDAPVTRKKDLLAAILERHPEIRRKDAKTVVDAMLSEMGDALSAGHSLKLKPLGRLRVERRSEGSDDAVLSLRLRREPEDIGGLAKSDDDA